MERKLSPIDFRHLETFCKVAEIRNFSKAADDLFLTQPTVSGHILSLEHSLGLRLFDRTRREARLTKAGAIFHGYASRILTLRKDALNALVEFSEGIRGELSLGASTIPGEYVLPRLLGAFKAEHPHLSVSIKIGDTKEIVQGVMEGRVEFGMTGAKLKHPSLHYELFGEDRIIVVGRRDPTGAPERAARLDQIFQKPWIVREEGSGTQMAVERMLKTKKRSLKQVPHKVEMGSTASVKEAVKAGLGWAFISRRAVEEDLSQGLLCQIEVEGLEPIARQIYIVSHRGRTLSPVGLSFLRFLRKRKGDVRT